jgi:acetyltransferase-like isoleucine patch superfamily enzyme
MDTKKIKKFLKSEDKILIMERDSKKDAVSEWKKVKNPLVTPMNFFIIQLVKFFPSMRFKKFFLSNLLHMRIGNNVGIAPCTFDSVFPELINIGDNSILGNRSHIATHEFTQDSIRIGRVKIGKNVLVGAFSVIRSGITIGDNSIISMCSFVNKDIPAGELWGGIPAKKIKKF